MPKLYRVSPSVMVDLVKVITNSLAVKSPVAIHSKERDGDGNFLVSVIAAASTPELAYAHALCSSAERGMALLLPAINKDSRHIGTPGERLEFNGNLYHVGAYIHPNFGTQYIHRIETDDGNEITWNTTKIHPIGRYKIACRVKEHLEYSRVKQTAVTHCKFQESED